MPKAGVYMRLGYVIPSSFIFAAMASGSPFSSSKTAERMIQGTVSKKLCR